MTGQELVLSKSSIDTWFDCERKWMYAYVYRIPGAPNLDMVTGTLAHAMVEAHWKGDDTEEALYTSWNHEMASMRAPDQAGALRVVSDARRLFVTYLDNIAPTFNPTIIERDFLIRVDGVLVSGRIDAADENDVHDTKTTSTPSKVNVESTVLGMTAYRHGYKSITGRFPKRLLLDVVAKNGRWKQAEVEPDDAGMAEVVGLVAKGIGAGEFKPTGAAKGECYRCSYSGICPSALLTPAIESSAVLESVTNLEVPLG